MAKNVIIGQSGGPTAVIKKRFFVKLFFSESFELSELGLLRVSRC